jgi:hypothetical protein
LTSFAVKALFYQKKKDHYDYFHIKYEHTVLFLYRENFKQANIFFLFLCLLVNRVNIIVKCVHVSVPVPGAFGMAGTVGKPATE